MLKFCTTITQQSKGIIRYAPLAKYNGFASSSMAEVKNAQALPEENPSKARVGSYDRSRSNMVAAAFASIHLEDNSSDIETPYTDKKIKSAITINELLSISEGTGVSRKHALKVVSVLSNWTTLGKVKLSDFENDQRFIRLCKILTKNASSLKINRNSVASRSEDLSTILSVTADEEAAKMVESITLSQMVKVMTTLSLRKRRSTLLLRALAYHISANSEHLDIKQAADLLFSVSTLNYYDENLFEKISNDIIAVFGAVTIKKSAVVGSILTSVGLLKYKNFALLDILSEWIVASHAICRPQDIFSLFMTLAVLNHIPSNSENLFKVLIPQLTQNEAGKPLVWLETVWSLVLLNQASAEHISSVLNESFLSSLRGSNLTTSVRLKLLNIDAAAQYLIKNYTGPRLDSAHEIKNTNISLSNDKYGMVVSVIETLKSLISKDNMRTKVNMGLGFYIDAECVLDKKCNPQPLTKHGNAEFTKVAVLVYDYHDLTKGRIDLIGINVLAQKILQKMGYKIASVLYTEFRPSDKIVHRVQYLETKLKEIVKSL